MTLLTTNTPEADATVPPTNHTSNIKPTIPITKDAGAQDVKVATYLTPNTHPIDRRSVVGFAAGPPSHLDRILIQAIAISIISISMPRKIRSVGQNGIIKAKSMRLHMRSIVHSRGS